MGANGFVGISNFVLTVATIMAFLGSYRTQGKSLAEQHGLSSVEIRRIPANSSAMAV